MRGLQVDRRGALERRVDDGGAAARHVRALARSEAQVDRHRDGADPPRGVQRHDEVRPGRQRDPHPVPGGHPALAQRAGRALRRGAQLRVGEAVDRLALGPGARRAPQPGLDLHGRRR